jgi:thioredoxin-like negative regulator of GroEL
MEELASFEKEMLGPAVAEIKSLAHLQKYIKKQDGVVINFWAGWSGPCLKFKDILRKVS